MCVECVPRKVSLLSTSLVHTPGLLAAMQNDYRCKSKATKKRALNVMKSWQNDAGFPSDETLIALLKGEIKTTIEKENKNIGTEEKPYMITLEHVVFDL